MSLTLRGLFFSALFSFRSLPFDTVFLFSQSAWDFTFPDLTALRAASAALLTKLLEEDESVTSLDELETKIDVGDSPKARLVRPVRDRFTSSPEVLFSKTTSNLVTKSDFLIFKLFGDLLLTGLDRAFGSCLRLGECLVGVDVCLSHGISNLILKSKIAGFQSTDKRPDTNDHYE